jgi:hypothetical protein
VVAQPERRSPRTLEEAVAELRRDPSTRVYLVVDGIEVEVRRAEPAVMAGAVDQSNLGDRIAALGPWQGESTDELVRIIRGGWGSNRALPDLL